jgi:rhodanese-related sulfurtransferase
MPDDLRISVNELCRRMEAGEDFTIVDTRNPQAWAESDIKLPDARRIPADTPDSELSKLPKNKPIVTYCT